MQDLKLHRWMATLWSWRWEEKPFNSWIVSTVYIHPPPKQKKGIHETSSIICRALLQKNHWSALLQKNHWRHRDRSRQDLEIRGQVPLKVMLRESQWWHVFFGFAFGSLMGSASLEDTMSKWVTQKNVCKKNMDLRLATFPRLACKSQVLTKGWPL